MGLIKKLQVFYILLIFTTAGFGQNSLRYILLEPDVYEYYDYQINSGQSIPDFVLRQPYEIKSESYNKPSSMPAEYFTRRWQKFHRMDSAIINFSTQDAVKWDKALLNRYMIAGGVNYSSRHITLSNSIAVDQEYKHDKNFAGDLSESGHWLYGRVNEAYILLNAGAFDVFFGRIKRNWGMIGQPSLILSNNPYSYDHLLLNYTTNHIKFSLIFAQLENMDALVFDETDSTSNTINNARKYMAGHRLDIRFSDYLQVGLTEMAMYGGANREFEWSYMNPMNLFYPIQRNDKKQMSGLWALDLYYKPYRRITLYGQFLIDDIIVNNDPGVDDRGQYPDRLGLMLSARSGDLLFNGLNSSLTYSRIWNRTYQSMRTYESYHYRGYGLGYPCASCEEIKMKLSLWNFFPLVLRNETSYGRYGNVELTDLFTLKKESFPLPPVKKNLINRFELTYFHGSYLNLFAAIDYRQNPNHYSNRFDERSHFVFKAGVKLDLSLALHIH